jgi:leucyl/phenylalanyl-tRNA---protein transferase
MPVEPPPCPWLFPDFADPELDAELDDDLVGRGADLAPGTVLAAYRTGVFPMPYGDRSRAMSWWSPRQRGVLELRSLKVSRSLARSRRRMEIRVDSAFDEVVDACSDPRREGGWIDDDIVAAYTELHRLGWAHSVESWVDDELVGGLYGVATGGLFAGESMFHRVPDASKVALCGLVDLLSDEYADARLLDVQWRTPHLASLGVTELPRPLYIRRLRAALQVPLPEPWR